MDIPVAETIICVECGGTAHLLPRFPPGEPPQAGDVIPYRCEECMRRFDVVFEAVEEAEEPGFGW